MTKSVANSFQVGDFVVYPAYGTGEIRSIEEKETAGHRYAVYVVSFEELKLRVKIPINKARGNGLRVISSEATLSEIIKILKNKTKIKKGMWNHRAREYEQKINSSDLMALAEVVRDTYRECNSLDTLSYSERQIFVKALERLVTEVATIKQTSKSDAVIWLNKMCSRDYVLDSEWTRENRVRETTPDLFDPDRHPVEVHTKIPSSMEEMVARRNFSGFSGGDKSVPLRQPSIISKPASPATNGKRLPDTALHKPTKPETSARSIKTGPPVVEKKEKANGSQPELAVLKKPLPPVERKKVEAKVMIPPIREKLVEGRKALAKQTPLLNLEKEVATLRSQLAQVTSERERLADVVAKLATSKSGAELTARRRAVEIENLEKRIPILIDERDKAGQKAQANASVELQRRAEKAEKLLTLTRKNASEERARLIATITELRKKRDQLSAELAVQKQALDTAAMSRISTAQLEKFLARRENKLRAVREELKKTKQTLRNVAAKDSNQARKIREQIAKVREELFALIEERTGSLDGFVKMSKEHRETIAKLRTQLRSLGEEPRS